MSEPVYLVRLESGLIVQHTREEYERYLKGVDVEAAKALADETYREFRHRTDPPPWGLGLPDEAPRDPRRRPVDPNECQEGC